MIYSENGTDPNEIHLVNANLSVLYLSNLELFHDYQDLAIFIEKDITSWLWPNYAPSVYLWNPELPTFVLNKTYSISVGGNASESRVYIPFEHWQNSKFLIRACAYDLKVDKAWVAPNWVIVNQTTASIQIDPKRISSVGVKLLWLQAQLITGAIQSSIANDFIVTNFVSFNFTNNNWELISSPSDKFVVINKIKIFDIIFSDEENDNIIIKTVDSAGLGVYIKTINTTCSQVYLNCDNESIKSATLVFSYTDIYHTDATYWQNFSVTVNVFVSEPPEFAQLVQNITINKCLQMQVKQILPSIVDPDSSLFEISFAEQVPSWIYISNLTESGLNIYYINVDWTSENSWQSYSSSMSLTVVLSDDSGAWTKYPFSINFESYNDIKFDHIDDISLDMSKPVQIAVNINNAQFYVEEWGTVNKINWIWYQSNDNSVFVFDQTKCGFTVGNVSILNVYRSLKYNQYDWKLLSSAICCW